jgi:hypothetical protein
MNPHAHVLRLSALAAVAILASLVFATVAQAAPPSPPDQIVFEVGDLDVNDAAEPVPGCSRLRLFRDGKRAGSASACFGYVFSVPYVTWFSAVITLHLPGGPITMATAPPNGGTTSCLHGWVDGFPLSYVRLNCSGPITSARGIFAGLTGVVTYDWWYVFDYGTGLRSWLQPPTITVDFS